MVEPSNLEGTPLSAEDIDEGRVLSTRGEPGASYAWDKGVAMSRYLAHLQAGKLLGTHCPHCDRTVIPPRNFCEVCFMPDVDYVELEDTGRINTFSICHVKWDVTPADPPELPAVIEIDGASEGMGILHLLGEVEPEDVSFGLEVEAVWKPAAERTGAITDIRYFRPRG